MIAHRGASGYRPEHSRAAYELAFAMGADAVEPDLVSSRDGVLVVRHENEISGTTDVAEHPEFADRRTTKTIDGERLSGWFTEDFSWAELSTLHATERLPELRATNMERAGEQGILRFSDLLALLDAADRPIGLVAEIKHATYFESIGLPLDELFAAELTAAGWRGDERLIVESFEKSVLGKIRARGITARYIYLMEAHGAPVDEPGRSYASLLGDEGLASLAREVDGISVDKHILLRTDAASRQPLVSDLVARAHAAGLLVFCWTLRAENQFLAKPLRLGSSPADFGDWRTEFAVLIGSGLDGVFADQPDLALEVRAALTA